MTESTLDVRGTRIRLLRGGDGPPLLYLHGSGDSGVWQPVLDELARDFDVIRPDHPGYGFSDEAKRRRHRPRPRVLLPRPARRARARAASR